MFRWILMSPFWSGDPQREHGYLASFVLDKRVHSNSLKIEVGGMNGFWSEIEAAENKHTFQYQDLIFRKSM